MDIHRLKEAKDRFENMKKMCEVHKATGCTNCGNICDTAIECIGRVLSIETENCVVCRLRGKREDKETCIKCIRMYGDEYQR